MNFYTLPRARHQRLIQRAGHANQRGVEADYRELDLVTRGRRDLAAQWGLLAKQRFDFALRLKARARKISDWVLLPIGDCP